MLEMQLVRKVNDIRFERIAEVAALKGSREFEQAVVVFGRASRLVNANLRSGGYSPAVRKLMEVGDAAKPGAKRRRSF